MTDARCEPPPELRGVPGYHWVETPSGSRAMIVRWGVIAQAWQFLSDETPYPLLGFRYLSPVLTPTEVAALRADAQAGWIYHNPDTGMEWAENHPVESGEVPDATCIQAATAPYLAEQLKRAWGDSFALRAERDALKLRERSVTDQLRRVAEERETALAELTTLRGEVENLRAALKPFADAAPKFRDCGDAIEVADIAHDATFTVGDLRRAATLANAVEAPE